MEYFEETNVYSLRINGTLDYVHFTKRFLLHYYYDMKSSLHINLVKYLKIFALNCHYIYTLYFHYVLKVFTPIPTILFLRVCNELYVFSHMK